MRLGRTILLLLAVAGAWAFWHFYEVKGAAGRQEKEAQAKRLLQGFNKDLVTAVDYQAEGSPAVSLRKSGADWVMNAPLAWKGDASMVDLLLTQAKDMNREETIDEAPAPEALAAYGLAPARSTLSLSGLSGTAVTVWFGIKNPTEQSVYARVSGRAAVVLVPAYSREGVLRKVDDLRDRTVWSVDPAKVVRLKATLKGFSAVLEKGKDGAWTLVENGKPVRTDQAKAAEAVAQLGRFKIRDFVDEKGGRLASFGLAGEAERLEAWEAGAAAPQVLVRGRESDAKDAWNCRVKGRPLVFTLDKYPFTTLENLRKDLPDRSAFGFKPFEVRKIVVALPGNAWTAEKQQGDWKRTSSQAISPAANADYDTLLATLAQAKHLGLKPMPAGKPEGTVTLYGEGGKPLETLGFYPFIKDTGTRVGTSASLKQAALVAEADFQKIFH